MSREKMAEHEEWVIEQQISQLDDTLRQERAVEEYKQQSERTEEAARKADKEVDRLPHREQEIDRGRGR